MKKTLFMAMLTATLAVGYQHAQAQPAWPEVTGDARPGARWWWMGSAVDAQNLEWNIGQYADCGMGSLEITPIYGVTGNEKNELSYLSEGWFAALKAAQQSGQAHGVAIDMNGGTGWPFGGPWVKTAQAAGKLVTKNTTLDADGTQALTMDVSTPESGATLSRVLAYQQDGDGVHDVTAMVQDKKLSWVAPAGKWLLIAVYDGHTGQQVKRAAPGGEGPVVDHYDADAVRSYLQHFDTQFQAHGGQWPRSFFNDSYEVYGADWTPRLFEQFEQRRGYKLEDHMDQLLGLGKRKDQDNQVLADYRQTLSDLLLDNFTTQWTQWAHGHGATTRNQGHGSPGNLLDFYGAVDIPETESFGISDFQISGLRQDPGFTAKNLSDLSTLKYASSAAHVMGRPLVSSETFTWLAEHFRVSLSQMKPDLDFFFLSGVNHIFFHGTTYSPREATWPGWKFYASIDMSPTNSIWRDAPSLMQYATRCQSFLQMGQPDNDLLVYAPFVDAMHKNTGANQARLQLFDINTLSQKIPSIPTTVKNVEAAGLDCDYISDRQLLATTCSDDGLLLTPGGATYRALVIPVTTHMPADVVAHIEQLEAQGARVVRKNDVATIQSLGLDGEALRTQLGLRVLRRKNATGHHYFITNLSKNDVEGRVPLAVPFQGAALFNPLTGSIKQASVDDGRVWLSLRSGESVILQTYNQSGEWREESGERNVESGESGALTVDLPVVEATPIEVGGPWTLSFTEDATPALATAFTLDKAQTWETLSTETAQLMGTGIYETTLRLTQRQLQRGDAGFRLNLGDVRESARVYINNVYAGCAWCAPFVLDVSGLLHEGDNQLRIEVTNLPANRISQMDRDGTQWRRFKDVNILDIVDGSTSVANQNYSNWKPVASGLASQPTLVPLRTQATALKATFSGFDADGQAFYPAYRLSAPSGLAVTGVSVTTADGQPYTDFTLTDSHDRLVLRAQAAGLVTIVATDAEGQQSEAYVEAPGAYDQLAVYDLTTATPPAGGWMELASDNAITGFGATGKLPWRRANSNGKQVSLFSGLDFSCDRSAYYFFYPGYGMTCNYDFTAAHEAQPYDAMLVSYLKGEGETAYDAADSLVVVEACAAGASSVQASLLGTQAMTIYRSVQLYRPRHLPIDDGINKTAADPKASVGQWFNLQGQRVAVPRRGLYIRNGRKTLVR
ncbi:MAG: glycosyl hydrolase family 2 [Prevotella sp.]|nr:glycosyl hydrolase family 2 [Prevotella sp.]